MIEIQKDVTVIGAGLSGICAAIAAAREGLSVALIHNRPVLGGNSSSEMRMWTRGSTGGENIYAEEMGILGEMKLENLYRNPQGNVVLWDEVLYDFIYGEPLIDLYLNTHISELVMKESAVIRSVMGYQQGTEKYMSFTSSVFIDASGDGTIGHLAGASFTNGREGRQVYHERLAPEQSDNLKLGSSILFHTRKEKHPVQYIAPKYAYTKDQIRNLIGKGGRVVHERMSGTDYWWIEYGGMVDTIGNNQEIALELKKIVFGLWDYIKNSGEFPSEHLTLEWVGSLPCKRESRRLQGEYVLTLNDIEKGEYAADGISYGGWYVDFHPPGGIYSSEEYCQQIPVSLFSIPMRTLYTKKIHNLLFTGRLISTSHLAFASTRIMNTCALLGQAAGSIAAYMHINKKTHHQIYTDHIQQLQENLVKNDLFIPGFIHTDPADMALSANITVSSTRPLIQDVCAEVLPLSDDFLFIFPDIHNAELQLNLDVMGEEKDTTTLHMSIHACENLAGFRLGKHINTTIVSLQGGNNQWITVPLQQLLSKEALIDTAIIETTNHKEIDEKQRGVHTSYILVLHAIEHISLRCSENSFTGFIGRFAKRKQVYNPCFTITDTAQETKNTTNSICSSIHLNNGYNRPFGSAHIWMSEACTSAWIECEWSEPKEIKEIRLYFNPNLSNEMVNLKSEYVADHHGIFLKDQMPVELVRKYSISIDNGGEWEKVVNISNNIKRMALHNLDKPYTTKNIRVDLIETWGSEYFELFEIRIY